MHSIKKAARRTAWYGDNEDPNGKNYNPFGRFSPKSHRATRDEENQLSHVQSENNAVTPIERQRNDDADLENGPFRGPAKPSTWSGNKTSGSTDVESDQKDIDPLSETSEKSSQPAEPNAPSAIVGNSEENADTSGKPRKRRERKFFRKLGLKRRDKEGDGSKKKEKKHKGPYNPNITIMSQLKVVFGSWINILLIAVPIGIAFGNIPDFNYVAVFVVNFIAIIPLAAILSYATEELAMYIGEVLGGLLNASFGNAVELIVSIIALTKEEVIIVQTSLVGSMLSNLLLVMGMCFFFGGINRERQFFNQTVAQTAASLLAISIGSLIIPTVFTAVIPGQQDDGVTQLSRGTAVLLLLVYACYLIFQLRTHKEVYNAKSKKVPKKKDFMKRKSSVDARMGLAAVGAGTGAAAAGGSVNQEKLIQPGRERLEDDDSTQDDDEGEEVPQLTKIGALLTLAIATVFIALCAEYMVGAINQLSKNISQEFIGLILLPIVGNAAEHATAVTVAIKDKMDLSIGVAVGSSLQIALLVFPLMVLLNWFGVGSPSDLNLNLDGFLVTVLFISVILVNYLIQDGESHWLEGVLLQVFYMIIAIAAWYYPSNINNAE